MPALADTHAHLTFPDYDADRNLVLQRAADAGLGFILNVGTDLPTSRWAVGMCRRGLWAAVGVHPHYADRVTPATLQDLAALAANPCVLAIGETGLDYYRNRCPRELQIESFKVHLRMATLLNKPVIIHSREAHAAILELLRQEPLPAKRGIMHCFSGSAAEARAFLDLGFHISLAGPVTYPRAHELRALLHQLPLDRLLLETDSPYLAPQPYRGLRNEPSYIQATYERVAAALGLDVARLADQINDNIRQLFPEISPQA
ncbi:MAG: TatD family hydrolase [Firmicutes bacterium]|jgi:TatD DNase family protein|nr:TatD family hydrolase [Bacillota bacterium]